MPDTVGAVGHCKTRLPRLAERLVSGGLAIMANGSGICFGHDRILIATDSVYLLSDPRHCSHSRIYSSASVEACQAIQSDKFIGVVVWALCSILRAAKSSADPIAMAGVGQLRQCLSDSVESLRQPGAASP